MDQVSSASSMKMQGQGHLSAIQPCDNICKHLKERARTERDRITQARDMAILCVCRDQKYTYKWLELPYDFCHFLTVFQNWFHFNGGMPIQLFMLQLRTQFGALLQAVMKTRRSQSTQA